jgi:Resolvase, N terminal domain
MDRALRQGWAVVVLDLGMDTTTPQGEMIANTFAAFAQFERRLIGRRTAEALAERRADGVRLGRPPAVPDDVVQMIRRRAVGVSARRKNRRVAGCSSSTRFTTPPTTPYHVVPPSIIPKAKPKGMNATTRSQSQRTARSRKKQVAAVMATRNTLRGTGGDEATIETTTTSASSMTTNARSGHGAFPHSTTPQG